MSISFYCRRCNRAVQSMTDPDNANVTYCPECALREATYPDHPAEPRQGLLTADRYKPFNWESPNNEAWVRAIQEAPPIIANRWNAIGHALVQAEARITSLEESLAEARAEKQHADNVWSEAHQSILAQLAAAEAARREAVERAEKAEALFGLEKDLEMRLAAAEEAAIQARQSRVIARNLLMKTERAKAAAEADAGRVRTNLEKYGDHLADCRIYGRNSSEYGDHPCSCGLEAALAAAAPETVE